MEHMTPEKAKDLGERALKRGMPFAEIAGLLDGRWGLRLGGYVPGDDLSYEPGVAGPHAPGADSWPDFRDPVTEAWLVAWGLGYLGPRGWDIDETPPHHNEGKWRIYGGHAYGELDVYAETRAEAWILALEKLKGEG